MTNPTKSINAGDPPLAEPLDRLKCLLEQIETACTDFESKDQHWQMFQDHSRDVLWPLCRHLHKDQYRKQLVQQFIAAIGKVSARGLNDQHLKVIRLTLEQLCKSNIERSDVIESTDAWQAVSVQTLPVLGTRLLELYRLPKS
jgi:hypothetical protein